MYYIFILYIWLNKLINMYPYHNKIKQRIKNGEATRYKLVDSYNSIKEQCLLIFFNVEPYIKPIRRHRFKEYEYI